MRTQVGRLSAYCKELRNHKRPGILNAQCEVGNGLRILLAQISWKSAKVGTTINRMGNGAIRNLNEAMKIDKVKNQPNNFRGEIIKSFLT